MIYYFTGTGNSGYVADTLANLLGETARFIPHTKSCSESFAEGSLGFVFPVYSWGVPPLVLDFIDSLPDSFWNDFKVSQANVWCVMTCGDETALAPEMLRRHLSRKGVNRCGIWSMIMPNNYVLLPGFNVDPVELEKEKLQDVPGRIMQIADGINSGFIGTDVTRGKFAGLKTRLIYPLFKKWGMNTKKWHYLPSCIGCGKCAKTCPLKNVVMQDGHPTWGTRCCSCLSCYHICPCHAVAYGNATKNKGQYFLKLN